MLLQPDQHNERQTTSDPDIMVNEILQYMSKIYKDNRHLAISHPSFQQYIGTYGDAKGASEIIQGMSDEHLLPPCNITQEFLRNLNSDYPETSQQLDLNITTEQLHHQFKRTRESTASSPPNRHIGHYRAALKIPSMMALIANICSIAFENTIALHRWQHSIHVIIPKTPNHPEIKRL